MFVTFFHNNKVKNDARVVCYLCIYNWSVTHCFSHVHIGDSFVFPNVPFSLVDWEKIWVEWLGILFCLVLLSCLLFFLYVCGLTWMCGLGMGVGGVGMCGSFPLNALYWIKVWSIFFISYLLYHIYICLKHSTIREGIWCSFVCIFPTTRAKYRY